VPRKSSIAPVGVVVIGAGVDAVERSPKSGKPVALPV